MKMSDAPFLREFIRMGADMYKQGWDERNGGNLSLLLTADEVAPYTDAAVLRRMKTGFSCPELDGRYVLVTGTGKYFKNIAHTPEQDIGLLRLADGGRVAELLWGFSDGGSFTSELAAHLMGHRARLSVDPAQRVMLHCHPPKLIAMTHVHTMDERAFTRTLWKMCTEAILAFPEGAATLPWMLCGTNAIGEATAEKLKTSRLVVWEKHGVYGAGRSLDDAFGTVETAEKAAGIWLDIAALPHDGGISDDALRQLVGRFDLAVRGDYLEENKR